MRKLVKILTLLFCLGLFGRAEDLHAAVLEVGAGKSYSTIQSAINGSASGDTILIYAGTYRENIVWPAGISNVTVRPAGSDMVKLEPGSNSSPTIKIEQGVQNITWDGMQSGTNSQFWIVGASAPPTNDGQIFRFMRYSSPALVGVHLKNLKLQGVTASSPLINGQPDSSGLIDDIRLENSYIFGGFSRAFEGQWTNEGIGSATWRVRLVGNTFDLTSAGYSGPEASHWDYVLIDRNYFYNNGTSLKYFIQVRNDQHWTIQNNILEQQAGGNCYAFIILRGNWDPNLDPGYSSNNSVINNTFVNSGSAPDYAAIFLTDQSSDNVIQNNLFVGTFSKHADVSSSSYSGARNVLSYNRKTDIAGNGDSGEAWRIISVTDGGNNSGGATAFGGSGNKPYPFWDLTAPYSGSGSNNPPTYDYNGDSRDPIPDIGAFEYAAMTLEVGPGKNYSTIQGAVNAAQPGDTILVYGGTYAENNVISSACGSGNYLGEDANKTATVCLKTSGSDNGRITLKAAPGEVVVIDGGSVTDFNIYGVSKPYWTIEGITFKNAKQTSILSKGSNAHDAEIKSCVFEGTATNPNDHAIELIGNDAVITGNTFNLPGIFAVVDIVSATNSLISSNTITEGEYGIYLHGGTAGSVVGENTISGIAQSSIFFRDSNDVSVRNNLVKNSGAIGILYQDENHVSSGCRIQSNTIDCSPSGGIGIKEQDAWADTTNNIIYNCSTGIRGIQNNNLPTGQPRTNLVYNATYSYYDPVDIRGIDISGIGTGNKIADPLFAGDSYALAENSPARNAGTALGDFFSDIIGTLRPQEDFWDIGAYEFVSDRDAVSPAAPSGLSVQ